MRVLTKSPVPEDDHPTPSGKIASFDCLTSRRTGVLAVETNVTDPAHTPEFNAWYDEMHAPAVLASPGYRAVFRLEPITDGATGRGGYLTLCEMHTDDFAKANAVHDERRIREYMIGDATPGA
jgi:hypothetical protein